MRNQLRPQAPYALYDSGQAIPKRPATPAQRAVLAAARQRACALRYYGTCPMCGDTEVPREDLARFGQCGPCTEAEEAALRAEDRAQAIAWARETLADPHAVVLDTETTDLDGEVIEIAVLTMAGEVLLESLVCPLGVATQEHNDVCSQTSPYLCSDSLRISLPSCSHSLRMCSHLGENNSTTSVSAHTP